MADVSVEFGAVDVGLEKTLKALQAESDTLKAKIRGTELSVTEADQAMRKMSQNDALEKKLKAMGTEAAGSAPKVDGLGKDIKGMGDKSEDAGKKGDLGFGKIAAGAALAGAAVKVGMMAVELATAAATKTIASFGAALDMGGRLNDLADRTGIAVDKVLLLERAFQNSGVGADSLGPIINKMQKAIVDAGDGTSKAAFAFADLGLSLSAIASLSPEEQLRTIGKAIAGVEDPAMRASLSMEIFGKSGGALNQVFANFDGEIETAKLQLGSLPDIMKEGSSQFDRISDNLVVVGGKFIEFAAGLIDKVKPALDAVTTALSMFDAAKVGQEIGAFFVGAGNGMKLFQSAVDSFKTGNFTDGFKLAWQAIVQQAKDTANSIYTNLVAAFKTAGDFLLTVFSSSSSTFKFIEDSFSVLGKNISATIAKELAGILSGSYLTQGLASNLYSFSNDTQAAADRIKVTLADSGAKSSAEIKKAFNSIPESFKENMADIPPLFDTVIKKQDEVVNKTQEIISADKEWEAQVMARIDKDVDASQKAFKDKKANQQTLATDQTAEDERAANARKKYEDDHKVQAELKREEIALQIQINNAIAGGDTKLADSLKNSQALNKTIKDLADAGLKQATGEAKSLANELARSAREADRVKNSLATKIDQKIKGKQENDAIDKGGELQKKAERQISEGKFAGARQTGEILAERELSAAVRGTGENNDRRNSADILTDYYGTAAPAGLSQKDRDTLIRQARDEGVFKDFSKMTDLSKKGLDRFADLNPDSKPSGDLGKKSPMSPPSPDSGKQGPDPSNKPQKVTLDSIVQSILDLVKKIEPKLPVAALAA